MAAFIESFWAKYKTSNVLGKLIFLNIGLFLLIRIAALILMLCGVDVQHAILQWVEFPSEPTIWLTRPWTIVTYMFLQYGIFHILFNMLWLYWVGAFFLYTNTPKQLVALYIYGGVAGALLYMAAYAWLPYFATSQGWLIGSSASVLAIVVATAWRMPDYKVGLLFIGEISLKWIAIIAVLLSVLSIPEENAGGNIAHIGGAIIGAVYGIMMAYGRDITAPFNFVCDKLVTMAHGCNIWSRKKKKVVTPTVSDEEILNQILDKIKKSGYSALSSDERRRLFDVSNRMK
jgi:membrane associated rhomboid family serine protease